MENYVYKPIRFFSLSLGLTWLFWIAAIMVETESIKAVLMIMGLFTPVLVAIVMIVYSRNKWLKEDFLDRMFNIRRLDGLNLLGAIFLFFLAITMSILLSTLFGESLSQFRFVSDFTFTGPSLFSALLTVLLASVVEELAWRGYAQDSLSQHFNWFKTSIIFGIFWAVWHLPLFWIVGTYHNGLRELGLTYTLNFFISTLPMAFMTNWVYVKNNRSILAGILYHLFLNFMQEKIAMTPFTKCIESFVFIVIVMFIVNLNKKLFFGDDYHQKSLKGKEGKNENEL